MEKDNRGSVPVERPVRRKVKHPGHVRCSFCTKRNTQVEYMLTGAPGACICSECVEAGMKQIILLREKKEREANSA